MYAGRPCRGRKELTQLEKKSDNIMYSSARVDPSVWIIQRHGKFPYDGTKM